MPRWPTAGCPVTECGDRLPDWAANDIDFVVRRVAGEAVAAALHRVAGDLKAAGVAPEIVAEVRDQARVRDGVARERDGTARARPWRVGALGRSVYQQVGSEPSSDDILIGVMRSSEWAEQAVRFRNVFAAAPTRATGPGKPVGQIFREFRERTAADQEETGA